MSEDIIAKIRERVNEDIMQYGPSNDASTILQHKVIDSYLLLQILDKLESMSLALDAMLDYNAAQWHERKTGEH